MRHITSDEAMRKFDEYNVLWAEANTRNDLPRMFLYNALSWAMLALQDRYDAYEQSAHHLEAQRAYAQYVELKGRR